MTSTLTRTRIDKHKLVVVQACSLSQRLDDKPMGFWYSVNGDWERWCQSEEPKWLEHKLTHQVTLGQEIMLHIRGPASLDGFHEEYKGTERDWPRSGYIDWARVAEKYDGIEIAPYIWSRRLEGDGRWYYSWDCASGCIWSPRGVKVELVKEATR